jgi:hypothetical protein
MKNEEELEEFRRANKTEIKRKLDKLSELPPAILPKHDLLSAL